MDTERPMERFRANAGVIGTSVLAGLWTIAVVMNPGSWVPLLFIGYLVVLPLAVFLLGDEADRNRWLGRNEGSSSDGIREETRTVDDSGDTGARDLVEQPAPETPLRTLRQRYAEGTLTDTQYERKIERLLETDTLENVESWAAQRRQRSLRTRELDRE